MSLKFTFTLSVAVFEIFLKGPLKYLNFILLSTSTHKKPYLFIKLQPEKGIPSGRELLIFVRTFSMI